MVMSARQENSDLQTPGIGKNESCTLYLVGKYGAGGPVLISVRSRGGRRLASPSAYHSQIWVSRSRAVISCGQACPTASHRGDPRPCQHAPLLVNRYSLDVMGSIESGPHGAIFAPFCIVPALRPGWG